MRPLLRFSKEELLDICKKNNIQFSVDKTNFDVSIKRNKIRHQIVSKLSKSEHNKILEEINLKNKEIRDIKNKLSCLDLSDISIILSLTDIEQKYALNQLLVNSGTNSSLSKENVGQIISILKSNKPNGEYVIKTGLILVKEYDRFLFVKNLSSPIEYQYILNSPGRLDTDYFYLDFTGGTSDRNVSIYDYPLIIRNIHKDDIIEITGYKVEARRLLIDWKVPYRVRLMWPVIINKDNKCVYIPRYQKDFIPQKDTNFYVKIKK